MRGYSDFDPMTRMHKGQTVEQIMRDAKADKQELPAKRKKQVISEDRAEVLRMMGLRVPKWAR